MPNVTLANGFFFNGSVSVANHNGFALDGTNAYIAWRFFALKTTSAITKVRAFMSTKGNSDLLVTIEGLTLTSDWVPDGTDKGGGSPTQQTITNASLPASGNIFEVTFANSWTPSTVGEVFCVTMRPTNYTSAHTLRSNTNATERWTPLTYHPVMRNQAGTVTRGSVGLGCVEIEYADGTLDGFLVTFSSTLVDDSDATADEYGVVWTQPFNATMSYFVCHNRTTSGVRWRVYEYDTDGTTLLNTLKDLDGTASPGDPEYFDAGVLRMYAVPTLPRLTLTKDRVYRIAAQATAGTNALEIFLTTFLNARPNWLDGHPMQTRRNNEGSWTDSTTVINAIVPVFDSVTIPAGSSGGSPPYMMRG